MSGLSRPKTPGHPKTPPKTLERSLAIALILLSAIAAPAPPATANPGGVTSLGSNTLATRHRLPRQESRNLALMDRYNALPQQARSFISLGLLGSLGLFAAFRPLDRRLSKN
ncbi:MAG: hypothetical protein HC824_10740 [Synechococcales cyanobacterium RM1_1_8]|nr:hypothetical protein [Synechococcales cyanobacterium RM1_1_8]